MKSPEEILDNRDCISKTGRLLGNRKTQLEFICSIQKDAANILPELIEVVSDIVDNSRAMAILERYTPQIAVKLSVALAKAQAVEAK